MADGSQKLRVGETVRVIEGVEMPEFPSLAIGGLTGHVVELRGRGAQRNVELEWTDAAVASLPAGFADACEARQLSPRLVILPAALVEPA